MGRKSNSTALPISQAVRADVSLRENYKVAESQKLFASDKSSYKAEITADCQGATFHRLDSV